MEIEPHVSLCVLKLFILHITLALLVEKTVHDGVCFIAYSI